MGFQVVLGLHPSRDVIIYTFKGTSSHGFFASRVVPIVLLSPRDANTSFPDFEEYACSKEEGNCEAQKDDNGSNNLIRRIPERLHDIQPSVLIASRGRNPTTNGTVVQLLFRIRGMSHELVGC